VKRSKRTSQRVREPSFCNSTQRYAGGPITTDTLSVPTHSRAWIAPSTRVYGNGHSEDTAINPLNGSSENTSTLSETEIGSSLGKWKERREKRKQSGYSMRPRFPSNDISRSKGMPIRTIRNGKSTLRNAWESGWPTICKGDESCYTSGNSNKGFAPSASRKSRPLRDGTTITSSGVRWEDQTTWRTASCSTQTAIDKSIANG